jgi:hypothetical protein
MGTLLAERGSDVPIIPDDALVYCDDDRINAKHDDLPGACRLGGACAAGADRQRM